MNFQKYPSIENLDRTKFVNAIIEEGKDYGEWVVSEKIHGCSFAIYMNKIGLKYARRNGFLTYQDNFYNFETVMDQYNLRFKKLYQVISELYNISIDELEVILYGELFGGLYPHDDVEKDKKSTTIQKGVYYSPSNYFYAFDIKVNNIFMNIDIFETLMQDCNFLYAKSLAKGFFKDVINYSNKFQTTIPNQLGLPEIENNFCEGVVIKPVISRKLTDGSRVILKNKNNDWKEKEKRDKTKKPKILDLTLVDDEMNMYSDLCDLVTENRLRNVLSHIGPVTDKMFGKVQGLFMKDVMEEYKKDNSEKLNSLSLSRKKVIQKNVNQKVQELVRKNFRDIIDGTF